MEDQIGAVQTGQTLGLSVHRRRARRPDSGSKEGLTYGPLDAAGVIILGRADGDFSRFFAGNLREMIQALRAPHALKPTAVSSITAVAISSILLRRPRLVWDIFLAITDDDAILFLHPSGVFFVALFLVSFDFLHPFSRNFFRIFFLLVRTRSMMKHLLGDDAVQVLYAVQLPSCGRLFQGGVVLVVQRPNIRAEFCEEHQAVKLTTSGRKMHAC